MLNRLTLIVLLMITCWSLSSVAKAESLVRGAEIDWSMRVVEGWYGGSYNQIRNRMMPSDSESPLMREMYEAMLEDSRYADAILFHLEPQLAGTQGAATRITSRRVAGSVYAAIQEVGLQEYIRMLGLSLRKGKRPGSSFRFLGQKSLSVGGKPAYRLEYATRTLSNVASRDLVYLIIRHADYHILHITVDERVYRARIDELKQMLSTLRYHD